MKKNERCPNPMFRWKLARDGSGYSVLTLVWATRQWSPIPFDTYILKYPKGSFKLPHRDPLKHGCHYRLNVFLTKPMGGEFICESVIYRNSRMAIFRPDISAHSVTPVEGHTRYVLSIGWTLTTKRRELLLNIRDRILNAVSRLRM